MASSADIAQLLEDEGHGTQAATTGWGIYIGKEPPAPATAITIYDTGGQIGNQDAQHYEPAVQIRVRGPSYAAAILKAEQIRDELILRREVIIGDWHYTGFWLTSDVAKIGTDEDDREIFTFNLRLMREPYTTA